MTNEEILRVTVLNSWKLAINRLGKTLSELSDEQLQQHVAPGTLFQPWHGAICRTVQTSF